MNQYKYESDNINKNVKSIKIGYLQDPYSSRERYSSFDDRHCLKQNNQMGIWNYIKRQNKEIDQIRHRQKSLNRSRILNEKQIQFKQEQIIPDIQTFLHKKTLINILKRAHQKQETIEHKLQSIQNHLRATPILEPLQFSCSSSPHHNHSISISKRGEDSIQRQIEHNKQLRNSKRMKVYDIINKSEYTRDKSLELKEQVYKAKPNGLIFAKFEISEFRRKYTRSFQDHVKINRKQQLQFIKLLNYLKDSDIKITQHYQSCLYQIREKLLAQKEITTKELEEYITNRETKEIAKLLVTFLIFHQS